MDQTIADALAASYAEFAADSGPVEGIVTPILDPAQKLVLYLLTICIEKHGLNLQTHTCAARGIRRCRERVARRDGSWSGGDAGGVHDERVYDTSP
ncbi:FAD dependent oxidoreductase [Mycena sanguinolenta]|uniref:FAD dependent oxidoreductase n=1 Tax=Mycena sanguinolenta TaxID=230812 RepID=A0A8H6X5V5_9AGAR|nr:FAD dependent oxidoreductase [Mycena sanguinolenta]